MSNQGIAIGTIAERLGLPVVGNADYRVSSIRYAEDASDSDIAIIRSKRDAAITRAAVLLAAPRLIEEDKIILYTMEPMEYTAVKIAAILIENNLVQDYSSPVQYTVRDTFCCGSNVQIGEGAVISPSVVIGDNVTIGRNCRIGAHTVINSGVQLGDHVVIGNGSTVGADSFFHYQGDDDSLCSFGGLGSVVIEDRVSIGCCTVIQRGSFSDTRIGACTQIGNHVDVGHDVRIGSNCKIVSQVGIAGNAVIGNHVCIYGQAGIANRVKIGDGAVIKAKSSVSKNVPNGMTIFGLFGRDSVEEYRLRAFLQREYSER